MKRRPLDKEKNETVEDSFPGLRVAHQFIGNRTIDPGKPAVAVVFDQETIIPLLSFTFYSLANIQRIKR